MRERELKLITLDKHVDISLSLPMRERELKLTGLISKAYL